MNSLSPTISGSPWGRSSHAMRPGAERHSARWSSRTWSSTIERYRDEACSILVTVFMFLKVAGILIAFSSLT